MRPDYAISLAVILPLLVWGGLTPAAGDIAKPKVIFEKPVADGRVLRVTYERGTYRLPDSGLGTEFTHHAFEIADPETGQGRILWVDDKRGLGDPFEVLDAVATGVHWVAVYRDGDKTMLRAGVVPELTNQRNAAGSATRPDEWFRAMSANMRRPVELRVDPRSASIRQLGDAPVFVVELRVAGGQTMRYLCAFGSGPDDSEGQIWWAPVDPPSSNDDP